MAALLRIKTKYKFFDEVYNIADVDKALMVVTDIQVRADSTYTYGCLSSDGTTKWFKEYEIGSLQVPMSKIGYTLALV